MKLFSASTPARLLAGFSALTLAGLTASAQMAGGAGGAAGMSGALPKLFGDIKGFSADAEVRVVDSAQQEVASMPMQFAFLNEKVRVEMDLTKMKNREMPPGMADTLKQMGMAHVVSIIEPEKKQVYAIYPDQKAVLAMPLPKPQGGTTNQDQKPRKTALGKETLDGHPCVKNKVVVKDDQGQDLEATTWNATDMKDFPLKIETKEKENTSLIHFSNVQLTQPAASLFQPPAGFTEYKDPMALQQAIMQNATKK